MNKHLKKIIDEYIIHELKFKNELLDVTEQLIQNYNNNWYYYDNYAICSESYNDGPRNDVIPKGKLSNQIYKLDKFFDKYTYIEKN